MFRYMLPVLATLLLGGGCTLREMKTTERHWEGSREVAGDLWEVERNRANKTPTAEATPDTTVIPDKPTSHSRPNRR